MVHCYFVHSFDLNRLTKEERDRVDMECSAGDCADDDEKKPIENNLAESKRVGLINNILTEKRKKLKFGRGDCRYRDTELDDKQEPAQTVDFIAIFKTVDIDTVTLKEGLKDYENDRDRFIGDLIDGVYGENPQVMKLWSALEMENDAKTSCISRDIAWTF